MHFFFFFLKAGVRFISCIVLERRGGGMGRESEKIERRTKCAYQTEGDKPALQNCRHLHYVKSSLVSFALSANMAGHTSLSDGVYD